MKRIFDFIVCLSASIVLIPVWVVLAIVIKLTSKGSVLHISQRVGKNNELFPMYKYRTMYIDTPQVATHLLDDPSRFITPIGKFMRKTSLDELPQLLNVIKGDMALVGPRPALFNQDDLVALRTENGIHELVPGITGWAQINGRDEIPIPQKVALEVEYLKRKSFWFDLKIIWWTVLSVIKSKNVSH